MNFTTIATQEHDRGCLGLFIEKMEYQQAWSLQRGLASARKHGKVPDVLVLLEHPHVYTIGRRGKDGDVLVTTENLEQLGAAVHHVDRGGEVTYHGPGQLVGYPIIEMRDWGGGPLAYVRALEQVLIDTLGEFAILAQRVDGLTGVWVAQKKIGAIGVRISSGITTHGFSLNVSPDLSFYQHIVPCGVSDRSVTSMACILGSSLPNMATVRDAVSYHFGAKFGVTIKPTSMDALREHVGLEASL